MRCPQCEYVWPDEMMYCPFCGLQLRCRPLDPDAEVLAMDMTRVNVSSLYSYIGMAEGWPSKMIAARQVLSILLRKAARTPMWKAVYTRDQITFCRLDSDGMPLHISACIGQRRKDMSVLGFDHLGDIVTPERLAAPYIMVFTNPDANCGGQVSMWRPCAFGGVNGSLFETMLSGGVSLVTSSTPMPRYALAPWVDCCYLPRLSTRQLFEIHQDRLSKIDPENGEPCLWRNMDEFVATAGGELNRWMQWALDSGYFVRVKAGNCG